MQTQALVFIRSAEVIITGLTLYFFSRVFFPGPNVGSDSYIDQ